MLVLSVATDITREGLPVTVTEVTRRVVRKRGSGAANFVLDALGLLTAQGTMLQLSENVYAFAPPEQPATVMVLPVGAAPAIGNVGS